MAYICTLCGKSGFPTKDELYTHRTVTCPYKDRASTPMPYKCSSCGVGFTTRSAYDLHLSSAHPITSYMCRICCKTYSSKTALANHQASWHSDATPQTLKCYYCTRTFDTKEERSRHILSVHGQGSGDPDYPSGGGGSGTAPDGGGRTPSQKDEDEPLDELFPDGYSPPRFPAFPKLEVAPQTKTWLVVGGLIAIFVVVTIVAVRRS